MHNGDDSSPFSVQPVACHAGNLLIDEDGGFVPPNSHYWAYIIADLNGTEEDSDVQGFFSRQQSGIYCQAEATKSSRSGGSLVVASKVCKEFNFLDSTNLLVTP